ncbi:MAG: DUF1700 domain-containing protein [Clostridia bacterium]|nr:DUF1700 domain-containing protein [Clostridia bacterium]
MTKYEWDRELKKNIHRLPDDEIKRVLEYYDELFEDYIERGKSEREIIAEFGNPCDVADKILADYDGELKSDDPFDTPPRKRGDESRTVFEGHDDNKTDVKSNDKEPVSENGGEEIGDAKAEVKDDNARTLALVAFIVINIVTGFAMFFILAAVWIVLGALVISGVAVAGGGVAAFVVSFGPLFGGGAASGLAQMGMSIATVGVGIAIVLGSVALMRLYAKGTKKVAQWFSKGVAK